MMCWMCRPTSNSIVLCKLHALCFNKEKWKHKDDVIRSGPMRKSFSCHVLFEQKQAFLLYCYMSMFFHFVRISVFNTFSGAGDSPMHAQLEITIEWTQRGAGNFIWKIISKLLKFIGELQLDTLHPIQLNNNEIVDAVRLRQSGFFRVFIERISNTFSCTLHIWKTHANPSICSFGCCLEPLTIVDGGAFCDLFYLMQRIRYIFGSFRCRQKPVWESVEIEIPLFHMYWKRLSDIQ